MKIFHFSLIFVILLLTTNSYAQTKSKEPVKQCSELFARQLVEQQAYDSRSIKETDKRINSFATISEVYKLADKSPDTVEKAQVFLGLAYIFEKVDHVNALDSLSSAIKTANKLETPNLVSGYAYQQIASREFGGYMMRYDVPGFDINKTFYNLSQKDFQGALLQADSFSDKYLRTLAVLAIVKDCRDANKPANQKSVKRQ